MQFLSKRSFILLGILLLTLIAGALITYTVYISPTGLKAREHADLTKVQAGDVGAYVSLDGSTVSLDDFRGEILVVNIWASWSPYTEVDHEILKKLKDAYGENITVLALDRKENKETAEAYLSTIGKKEGLVYIIDTTDHFFNSLGGYAMPETIVFDTVGNEYYRRRGTLDEDEIRAAIDALMKK